MLLTSILESQGFSPMEAKVYLTNLELGLVPASVIARKLEENRVTVYSTLQNLIKRDLILTVTKNKVVHYSAISPKNLLKKSQEKVDQLSDAMSELLALTMVFNDKPSVQFYEGVEGLKMLYDDTLEYPSSTIKAFLWYAKLDKNLERYLTYTYLPKRMKKKIVAQVLIPQDVENSSYAPMDKKDISSKWTQIKIISDPIFQVSNEINLYGNDKIALMMFHETEMMWLLIKSKMLYTTLASLFDLTWKRETDE